MRFEDEAFLEDEVVDDRDLGGQDRGRHVAGAQLQQTGHDQQVHHQPECAHRREPEGPAEAQGQQLVHEAKPLRHEAFDSPVTRLPNTKGWSWTLTS